MTDQAASAGPFRRRRRRAGRPPPPLPLPVLALLALALGVATGLAAVVFRELIGLIHNLLYFGRASFAYDADRFGGASVWGVGVILVPVLGAAGVTLLIDRFAPETRGPGVPEVLEAMYYRAGAIRFAAAPVKLLASALALGSGASVGREGPIIHVGAALASGVGGIVAMPASQRIALMSAAAAAGVAATFNTPLGGVLFAVELLMPEISVQTFLPVALAAGAATVVGRVLLGDAPVFDVTAVPAVGAVSSDWHGVTALALCAVLGALAGVLSAGFIHSLRLAEAAFARIPSTLLRHMLGMFGVGLMMWVLFVAFGEYFIDGVGYAAVEAVLTGGMTVFWMLVLLCLAKVVATALSLGSGSSGGIFSPSLFIGATLGAGLALALRAAGLPAPLSVPGFAMVGMAAMVGGATGAVMTAVVMISEMTLDYGLVMPAIVAVAVSLAVRRTLSQESVYTWKLALRGLAVPKARRADMFLVRAAREVMDRHVEVLPAETSLEAFLARPDHGRNARHVVVTRRGRVMGALSVESALQAGLKRAHAEVSLGELASKRFAVVRQERTLFEVIRRVWRRRAAIAVVVDAPGVPRAGDVVGVISKDEVADCMADAVKDLPR